MYFRKMSILGVFVCTFIAVIIFSPLLTSKTKADDNLNLIGEFDTAKAMQLIYGNFDVQKQVSTWKPGVVCNKTTYRDEDIRTLLPEPEEDFESKVALLSGFSVNGVDKYHMLTSTTWDDCHACRPILGIFVWKKQKKGWQLESADKCFGMFGSWGALPEKISLVQLDAAKFGVMFEETNTAQMETILYYNLITQWNKVFKVALDGLAADSYEYEDGCDKKPPLPLCYDYSSQMRFLPDKSLVSIKYSGTYLVKTSKGEERKPLDYSLLCTYDNDQGEYVKNENHKSKCLDGLFFQKRIE